MSRNSSTFCSEHRNLMQFAELILKISWSLTPPPKRTASFDAGSSIVITQNLNLSNFAAGVLTMLKFDRISCRVSAAFTDLFVQSEKSLQCAAPVASLFGANPLQPTPPQLSLAAPALLSTASFCEKARIIKGL